MIRIAHCFEAEYSQNSRDRFGMREISVSPIALRLNLPLAFKLLGKPEGVEIPNRIHKDFRDRELPDQRLLTCSTILS
jgi:hypothetical protein